MRKVRSLLYKKKITFIRRMNIQEFSKKKFITNIIFGQKMINDLSLNKKKNVNIEYFLNYLNCFKKYLNENWESKIEIDKYTDLIPQDIENKLMIDSEILLKNNHNIEPYCKKAIKIISPLALFQYNCYHYKLVKLESTHYDLMSILYYNNEIIGYVCCAKRSSGYKNIYIVLLRKYDKKFYEMKNKKIVVINEISEDISFYEKECYTRYIKHIRSQLFSVLYEVLKDNKTIRNIVCIGDEEGGNFLQLFLVDFLNNKNDFYIKIDDFELYLFSNNTAKLSTDTFYKEFIELFGKNSLITCFSEKNDAHKTWENMENMNIILL
jgi:hypothetical protein